jgi:hypothetical protein
MVCVGGYLRRARPPLTHAPLFLAVVRRARWWLCASESYPNCLPSKDFSDYYKRPVFVCQVA